VNVYNVRKYIFYTVDFWQQIFQFSKQSPRKSTVVNPNTRALHVMAYSFGKILIELNENFVNVFEKSQSFLCYVKFQMVLKAYE
jgi:hypothetical protein